MGTGSTGWVPPHCPNPNCTYFNTLTPRWPFRKYGFYVRQRSPRRIQRFTCGACKRHFSSQTFSGDYWLKRPELPERIASMVVGCMGNRQMARALGCAHSTVGLQIARLARSGLLFQASELDRLKCRTEIVVDGFESFEWSQYFPMHHHVAVDVESGYFLFHTDSELRRKGRMTAHQKARRAVLEAELGRPSPKAVERGMRELLEEITRNRTAMTIRSDDHRAYPRAMASLDTEVTHRITSSKERRDSHNPLWEVNLLDLMIRHSTACHKRETIAWAKRRQASIEKLLIFQVWRNYVKRRWEKGPRATSAMEIGLAKRPMTLRELFRPRRFFGRVPVPVRWQAYYRRDVVTRALRVNRGHDLTYAL